VSGSEPSPLLSSHGQGQQGALLPNDPSGLVSPADHLCMPAPAGSCRTAVMQILPMCLAIFWQSRYTVTDCDMGALPRKGRNKRDGSDPI